MDNMSTIVQDLGPNSKFRHQFFVPVSSEISDLCKILTCYYLQVAAKIFLRGGG